MESKASAGIGESLPDRGSVDRAAQSAHEAIDRVAAKAGPAVERMRSAAASAAERLQGKAGSLGEAPDQWLDSCRTYVRENPLTAVGIAVAAGVLLSRLSSR